MDEPETASVSSSGVSTGRFDDGFEVAIPTESPIETTAIETTIPVTAAPSVTSTTKTDSTNITTSKIPATTTTTTSTTTITTTEGQNKSQNIPPWRSYNGPKLYVKPVSRTSNQQIIHRAVAKALEGAANANTLKKIQETIQASIKSSNHFLILFRNHQFKGIYDYNEKLATITKLDGLGPKIICPENIVRFYKFDSTKRAFTEVETKQIGPTIIAISLSTFDTKK